MFWKAFSTVMVMFQMIYYVVFKLYSFQKMSFCKKSQILKWSYIDKLLSKPTTSCLFIAAIKNKAKLVSQNFG